MTIKSKKAQLESVQNSSSLIKVCANHSFTEALGREGIKGTCSINTFNTVAAFQAEQIITEC